MKPQTHINHTGHTPGLQSSLTRPIKTVLIRCFISLSCLLALIPAAALEMNISAQFKPDPSNPQHNVFENLTPNNGGYCKWYPAACEAKGIKSLKIKTFFSSINPIAANHTDPRQGAMVSAPSEWRSLTVTHNQTGEVETVKVRINGLGSSVRTAAVMSLVEGSAGSPWQAHNVLWNGGNWGNAPAPCARLMNGSLYTVDSFDFFWQMPSQGGSCGKSPKYPIPWMRFNYIDFSYELVTPNPLSMSSGDYTGSITYTLGPRQDFDMGDNFLPDDPILTLNFSLSVKHVMKIELPPGGNQIVLEPKGGWQLWRAGRRPETLFRDQTFLVYASSRFKMQLACERVIGDTCGLSNGSQHAVPVHLFVSLPNGLRHANGASVNRQPLLLSGVGTEMFEPTQYVDRKPGTLHFEIDNAYVAEMLFQEGTYKGSVTVIWDSEV